MYGRNIDFYNVQYYNQGYYAYSDYSTIFTNDPYYYASVQQLMNASSVNSLYTNIPVNKIIVGKCVFSEVYYSPEAEMGFVQLYSSISTYSAMNNYVIRTATDNTDLQNWYANSGIMVWVYRTDISNNDNTQILDYYRNVKH